MSAHRLLSSFGFRPGLFAVVATLLLITGVLLLAPPGHDPDISRAADRPTWRPDPVMVELGRKLFRRSNPAYGCATCHGLNARGSALGPALRGAAPVYFKKYENDPVRVIERMIRHIRDPDTYPAIASDGDYIAPMPPYTRLPREELEALAVYVMSLTRIT